MDTGAKIQHWDKMYEMPLENIPWEIVQPPKELVEVIDSGQAKGKKALDIARKHNEELKLPVRFAFADVTKIEEALKGEAFDFILDYSILHHLEPTVTASYAHQCADLLNPGGKLLLVCYSDKDEFASGSNAATGTYGNTMFYRTADEIREAYKELKELSYKESSLGKRLHHIAHCFLFEKA